MFCLHLTISLFFSQFHKISSNLRLRLPFLFFLTENREQASGFSYFFLVVSILAVDISSALLLP